MGNNCMLTSGFFEPEYDHNEVSLWMEWGCQIKTWKFTIAVVLILKWVSNFVFFAGKRYHTTDEYDTEVYMGHWSRVFDRYRSIGGIGLNFGIGIGDTFSDDTSIKRYLKYLVNTTIFPTDFQYTKLVDTILAYYVTKRKQSWYWNCMSHENEAISIKKGCRKPLLSLAI